MAGGKNGREWESGDLGSVRQTSSSETMGLINMHFKIGDVIPRVFACKIISKGLQYYCLLIIDSLHLGCDKFQFLGFQFL